MSLNYFQLFVSFTQTKTFISPVKEKIPVTLGVNRLIKNPVYALANLKLKSAFEELREALEVIIKQQKKRRQH